MSALFAFVFFGLFTPGPNVIMLTTAGAQVGLWRSLPHLLGVVVGVGITSGLTGLGIGALLLAMPALKLVFQIIAVGWILWMAYQLWINTGAKEADMPLPFTFPQAVLFQWVNPKVWAVAVAASAYVQDIPPTAQALTLAVTFSGTNLFVCLFWTTAGGLLSYLLTHPAAWRIFYRIMAAALALSGAMVFL